MGNGRFEAYKDGLFTLDQLVTVKPNPVWGPSAQVTSLAGLLKGRGGGAPPLDPAALLATHQSKVKPQKPKTLAVDDKNKALLEALTTELDKTPTMTPGNLGRCQFPNEHHPCQVGNYRS